jgi:hypothetical protein
LLHTLFQCYAGRSKQWVNSNENTFVCIFTVVFLIFNSEPTKISRKYLEDGTKVRVSRKTGTIIPKPLPMFDRQIRSTCKIPNFIILTYSSITL